MHNQTLIALRDGVQSELIKNILPFWMTKMTDNVNGGYYGQINGEDKLIPEAEKGGILNARILWTFSSAYILLKDPQYLKTATRAKDYILNHFFDAEHGGTYWSLNADGSPADTKKQIYSLAFFIYALSEFHRATGDALCLAKAQELFRVIEKHSFDNELNGYFEAYSRDWHLLGDLRLSEKDANEKKTMNTHLHILEAYTNLYRVWKNEILAKQLKNLIQIFLDKILDSQTYHLNLFFDENWNCKSNIISYGHDIEASWLIEEAAVILADEELLQKAKPICLQIAVAAKEGIQKDGSIIYEKDESTGHTDFDRHWWPQAEALVGFINAYEYSKSHVYLEDADRCWKYIKENLVDKQNGEWFWSIKADGSINRKDDKAGFWKCPYHNARACLEIIRRVE